MGVLGSDGEAIAAEATPAPWLPLDDHLGTAVVGTWQPAALKSVPACCRCLHEKGGGLLVSQALEWASAVAVTIGQTSL